MNVYYIIGLDEDHKPVNTMRIASRSVITQEEADRDYKGGFAKVVITQEVSDMGVAVESATNDRQAALDGLGKMRECVDLLQLGYKPPHIGQIVKLIGEAIDAHELIRAALTAPVERIEGLAEACNTLEDPCADLGCDSGWEKLCVVIKAARAYLKLQGGE